MKTPQKFPPEKGLRPSLHPTDDEIIELNDEIYTANLDDQDKTAILFYRTAFEAGQKSERQRIFAEVDKILLDVDIDENLWEKLKTELSK